MAKFDFSLVNKEGELQPTSTSKYDSYSTEELEEKYHYALEQFHKRVEIMDISNKELMDELDYWRTESLRLCKLLLRRLR